MYTEQTGFDPFDPDLDEDKRFTVYRQARDRQPVMLHEGPRRIWSVFRYEDIFRIVHDHETFPSVPEFKDSFADVVRRSTAAHTPAQGGG